MSSSVAPAPPTPLDSHSDGSSPTAQELQWARAIRQAAQDDPHIHHETITDLEFFHHALVAKHNVAKALLRLQRIQDLKQRMGIAYDGSCEKGQRDLRQFWETHAGFVQAIGSSPSTTTVRDDKAGSAPTTTANTSTPVVVCGTRRHLDAHAAMKTDEAFAVAMRGTFYMFQAAQSNIAAMRSGVVMLVDEAGLDWSVLSFTFERQWAKLYSTAYPVRVKRVVMCHSNWIARLFLAICRPFLSRKIWEAYEFPAEKAQTYWQKFPNDFPSRLIPVAWGGSMTESHWQTWVFRKLKERYALAETFRLDDP